MDFCCVITFSIIATTLVKCFNHAKKLRLDSLHSLKEMHKQYGIDESKIIASINKNQQEDNGNIKFKNYLI